MPKEPELPWIKAMDMMDGEGKLRWADWMKRVEIEVDDVGVGAEMDGGERKNIAVAVMDQVEVRVGERIEAVSRKMLSHSNLQGNDEMTKPSRHRDVDDHRTFCRPKTHRLTRLAAIDRSPGHVMPYTQNGLSEMALRVSREHSEIRMRGTIQC